MNILRLHLHIESIHANGSDDQRGVEALSARSSSSFLEVTWRLQEGATPLAFYSHLIQWFYPVFSSIVSCCFHRFFRSNGGGFACTGTYSINLLSSASSFSRGLEHCNYVLWRNIHQDIVNRLKHEPATRSPNRYELAHIHSPGPSQEFRAARVCRVSQPLLQKVT